MQIAFISDIHANLVSFEAVLRDIDRRRPDRIVFLGDACTLGPQPRESLRLLKSLDCPCVMGNHDAFVLDRRTAPNLEWTSRWFAEQLEPEDLDFLRTFAQTLTLDLDGERKITCYHGSPKKNTDQILPVTPAEELDALLEESPGPVYFGGHTHIQMVRQHLGRLVVNAGSVGMPFQKVPFSASEGPRLLPWAEYTLFHLDGQTLGIEPRRIAVDLTALRQSYENSAMPDAMYWWSLWLTPEPV